MDHGRPMDVDWPEPQRTVGRLLLVSTDPALIERIQRLSSVVPAPVDVSSPDQLPRSAWATASLVLVDIEAAGDLSSLLLPRRAGTILLAGSSDVLGGSPPMNPWQVALRAGCAEVAVLPESEPWLIEQLQAVHLGAPREGRLIAVTGASGGVGASTLALALAAGQPHRRSVLVDTDRFGGGIDVLLGAEGVPGIRWPDLLGVHGRLSPAALDYALPHAHGIAVVSFGRDEQPVIAGAPLGTVLDAAMRGYDLVVVDLVRSVPPMTSPSLGDGGARRGETTVGEAVLTRADSAVVVVGNGIRATAAAVSVLAAMRRFGCAVHVVVRTRARGLTTKEVCSALGTSSAIEIPEERLVLASGEAGEIPSARSQLMRASAALHRRLAESPVTEGQTISR